MRVFIERINESKELPASSVKELLASLGVNPEVVLVAKNGVLVTLDEPLSDNDEVKILSVVSGG